MLYSNAWLEGSLMTCICRSDPGRLISYSRRLFLAVLESEAIFKEIVSLIHARSTSSWSGIECAEKVQKLEPLSYASSRSATQHDCSENLKKESEEGLLNIESKI